MKKLITAATAAVVVSVPAPAGAAHREGCNTRACDKRVERKEMKKYIRPYLAWIAATARCESGGDWDIATGNGYFGGLQFSIKTWRWMGGKGRPDHAAPLRQKYIAVKLVRKDGPGHWPVCGVAAAALLP